MISKILLPAIIAFCIGIAITPFLTNFLYKHKLWKKKNKKVDLYGKPTPISDSLHSKETSTPRLGGIIIWGSSTITIIIFWFLSQYLSIEGFKDFGFLNREQTWIPFSTLLLGAFVGLIDDILEITGTISRGVKGLSLKLRLLIVGSVGLFCGFWFFNKLDVVSVGLPNNTSGLEIGWLIIPLFALVLIGIYAGGVIDGIDGLAGGVFAIMFAAYAGIAFAQNQFNISAFSAMLVGAILAFLWFNVPPARFYMSETGTMALTISLGVIAFMTDSLGGGYGLLVLPIIAFPLAITVAFNIIQVASKRIIGKKILLVAPLHHHFEAIGWPSYKVTMRYWIISIIAALLGMIFAVIG